MSENAQDDFGLPSVERSALKTMLEHDLDVLSGQLEDKTTGWYKCPSQR